MKSSKSILITGGAGFIGANAVRRFARNDWEVVAVDDLSRAGAARNVEWLRGEADFRFERADVRDRGAIERVVKETRPDVVLHLAGQVAVTTSVANPRADFEINALGALNVLEAARAHAPEALLLYASTNKVYGNLAGVGVELRDGRWEFHDRPGGISEKEPLDFHSPYGCSKGAADQYFLDYRKSYGLRTAVFRQSCIYGPRQFGVEDQGWLAWFIIATVTGRPITLYGDGRQIRDVLYVDDLLSVYEAAIERPDAAAGQAFNIGGGPENTLSLLELVAIIEARIGRRIVLERGDWRVGDQKVFVCDIRKARERLGWEPKISCREGVERLSDWVEQNRPLFLERP